MVKHFYGLTLLNNVFHFNPEAQTVMHNSKERTLGSCGLAYCLKAHFLWKHSNSSQSDSTTDYSGYHLKNIRPTNVSGGSKDGKLEFFRRESKEVFVC